LLVAIVAQTELPIAVITPAICLWTQSLELNLVLITATENQQQLSQEKLNIECEESIHNISNSSKEF